MFYGISGNVSVTFCISKSFDFVISSNVLNMKKTGKNIFKKLQSIIHLGLLDAMLDLVSQVNRRFISELPEFLTVS